MHTKMFLLLFPVLPLCACVAGAPRLTADQQIGLEKIAIYKVGENPEKAYRVLQEISAADCSGAPAGGRVWGNAEKAIETLKRKAAALKADAIVNVSCGAVPFLNNCWAAKKCNAEAVVFQ